MCYAPHDLKRDGLCFTSRKGVGVRLCNLGLEALARGGDIDRFWGPVDPDVAGRALGRDRERPTESIVG